MKEHDALDLLSGLSQTPTQDLDELDRDLRFCSHQRQKVSPLDDEHLAIADGYRIRCAWTAVEQGNFSEDVTLGHEIDHDLIAVGRGHSHFRCPLADREKTRTRIVLCKNDGASLDRFFDNAGR